MKSTPTLIKLIAENPASADWWIETETLIRGCDRPGTERFRDDRAPYAELRRIALGLVDEPLFTEADYQGLACGEEIECICTD